MFCNAGHEWKEIRTTYLEQMAGLDALHQNVSQSLDRLYSETKGLQAAEQSIRDQQEKLRATCEQFEQKYNQHIAKGEKFTAMVIVSN